MYLIIYLSTFFRNGLQKQEKFYSSITNYYKLLSKIVKSKEENVGIRWPVGEKNEKIQKCLKTVHF